MKSNQKRLSILNKILNRSKHVNKMSPFPLIDTEYIEMLENEIKYDPDRDPVECCGHCKALSIKDEDGLTYCKACGTNNPKIEKFDTIFEWNNEYGSIWNLINESDEQKTSDNKI